MLNESELPAWNEEQKASRTRVLLQLLRVMAGMTLVAATAALFNPRNSVRVTIGFYTVLLAGFAGVRALVQRGYVRSAAWILSIFFWLLMACVTLFFGGLQGENAAVFGVGVMVVGGTVGGWAAIGLAVASSIWCGVVMMLELHHALPAQVGAYNPLNAWIAITVSLILMSLLLNSSLRSLRQLHERAEASARERDTALRRSIQAQKMELVGNLTSGIAHDFNNLVTVMRGATHSLRDQAEHMEPDALDSLEDLDAATTRAALMSRQLLAFGRSATEQSSALDLGMIVRSLEPMLPRLMGGRVRVRISASMGAVMEASRVGIEQILLNLAVNARDAMGGDGEFSVAVVPDGDHIVLEVRDTGSGMDEATQARVFEPFFTTKPTGTGLGLATVRDMVQRFHGTVRIESSLGKGTTFVLRFPRVLEANVSTVEPASEVVVPRETELRILLVEDDFAVRRSTARLLARSGHEVVQVADGAEALALLANALPFACVVSDVAMPRLDGESLANELASLQPDLPVVLMSGDRMPAPQTLARRGRSFVPKPAEREALLHAIEVAIRGMESRSGTTD